MISVCKEHMKKGLTVLNCPHVLLINKYECRKCCFCKQRASYKLFIPCLTMIVLKRNGWKKYENRTPSFPEGVLSLEREERRLT